MVSDGLTVDSSSGITVNGPTNQDGKLNLVAYAGVQDAEARIQSVRGNTSGTDSRLQFLTNNGTSLLTRVDINDNGDISFYEDTGTTAKLFWDAADETISIGLGASSTATISAFSRTVSANLPSALRIIENTGASTYWDIGANNGSSPNLNFYVNANISPKVTFASSGNVGIGTSSPSAPLNVVAGSNANAIRMNGRSSDNYSELYASSNDGSTNYSFLQGHSAQTKLYTLTSTPLLLGTNSTEAMRIDSSGLVGIGTSAMSSYNANWNDLVIDGGTSSGLTVVSATTGIGTLAFADGTTGNEQYRGYVQYSHNDDELSIGVAGALAATIDSSGNVGIGTDSPNYKLDVSGNANINGGTLAINAKSFANITGGNSFNIGGISNSGVQTLTFFTNTSGNVATERMRIDSSGRLS